MNLDRLYWLFIGLALITIAAKAIIQKMNEREERIRESIHDFYLEMRADYLAEKEKDNES